MENCFQRPISISFENLNYSVQVDETKEKHILKNISGHFKSGNISAILGPSGGGKTTLLNILSGYTTTNISGTICVNGGKREWKKFQNISRYIMEGSTSALYLTVNESMYIASRFRLGNVISKDESQKMIETSLQALRLSECRNTLTNNLSGGEEKRLVIALELLGCPSIIFLDEPTTGLDEANSFTCISLLKKLAEQGYNVIVSIHSPSKKVFEQFHHVYVVTDGQCVFQGPGSQILPFLEEVHIECPLNYDPIDFLVEVASGGFGNNIDDLVELINNGAITYNSSNLETLRDSNNFNELLSYDDKKYFCTYFEQFRLLMLRSFLQAKNNTTHFFSQFIMMILLMSFISLMYYDCGNNGSNVYINLSFLYFSICKFLYLSLVPPLLKIPLQMKLVQFEYFNKLYDVLPFFFALSLKTLPYIFTNCIIYTVIVYPLTGQPIEIERMTKFFLMLVSFSLVTDAICQIIGTILDPVNSLFLGLCILIPLALLSIQSVGFDYNLQSPFYQFMTKVSYVRLASEGLVTSIYNNREKIHCPEEELLCPFHTGNQILTRFGYGNSDYQTNFISLIVLFIVIKIFGLYVLNIYFKPNCITNKLLKLRAYLQIRFHTDM